MTAATSTVRSLWEIPESARTPPLVELNVLASTVAGVWAGMAVGSVWVGLAAFSISSSVMSIATTLIKNPKDPSIKHQVLRLATFIAAIWAGISTGSGLIGVATWLGGNALHYACFKALEPSHAKTGPFAPIVQS